MARKIPAVLQTGTQNRYHPTNERGRNNQLVRERTNRTKDFIKGVGQEALYQITSDEYKREPDSIKILDLIRLFTEFYMPNRNTYYNRGDFFWAKQTEDETPDEFWRLFIEIEKECNFNTISAEELLMSKYMTAITDFKKYETQNNERENSGNEENNRTNQTEHVRKKNKMNTNPEALISTKEKHIIKEERLQRMERFGVKPKNKNFGN